MAHLLMIESWVDATLRSAPAPAHPHPLPAADNVLTAETDDVPSLLSCVDRLHGVPGADPKAVERACRKDLTRATTSTAGVPGPRFALTRYWPATAKAAAELGYPLVVEPVDLCAGMHVREVGDETALREAYLALEAFPVNARGQERVPTVLLEAPAPSSTCRAISRAVAPSGTSRS